MKSEDKRDIEAFINAKNVWLMRIASRSNYQSLTERDSILDPNLFYPTCLSAYALENLKE